MVDQCVPGKGKGRAGVVDYVPEKELVFPKTVAKFFSGDVSTLVVVEPMEDGI